MAAVPGAPAPFSSAEYWRNRYRAGGTSGAGAYGRLSVYKAHVVNTFVEQRKVQSVIEFGSGDGNQASLFHIPSYTGVDVSAEGLEVARSRLTDRTAWRLIALDEYLGSPLKHEMALSLDVIYHLVEDEVFEAYMRRLFEAATRFVLIYSSDNFADAPPPHVRHRHYSAWIEANAPAWRPARTWTQPFPFTEGADPHHTSFSFFRLFRTTGRPRFLRQSAVDRTMRPHSKESSLG